MNVFLIPTVTPERYELYYEAPDGEMLDAGEAGGLLNRLTFGLSERLKRRFDVMLLEAEDWRHRRKEARPEPASLLARARRKTMGFIVERIAEQRLLWHLRKVANVCVHVPTDLMASDAEVIVRAMLTRDADHHRKWFWIDAVLLLLCAPLVVIPGPNIPGFYFTFQVVSHYLSWTGAKNGLALSPWPVQTCVELSELRGAMALASPQRQRRFHELADRLRLEHLPTFLEDVAARPA
ncbi:MAG TPA: hypothetical protein VMO26_09760 [Vicinamibacterales bacterium]|nr:hypothetical protein [Vicinamibacterales bacterium]